jgi:hypothetical protein
MLAAFLTTLAILGGLAYALRSQERGLIDRHRYNNRHNDAPGARADNLLG